MTLFYFYELEPKKDHASIEPHYHALSSDFSWLRFIFMPFWLLRHKAWFWFLAYVLLYAILVLFAYKFSLEGVAFQLIYFLLNLGFTLEADTILSQKLQSKGFKLARVIPAKSLSEAEYFYFHKK